MARHTYPGTLVRRGPGHWWWRYQVAGRRYSRTFDVPDRAAAERHIRNVLLEQVEADDVSQRTLRRDYAVLHLVFEFAVEREYRGDNPVRAVKKPPRGDEREAIVLSAEQVEKLLDACAEHPMLHLFVLTCSELALRPNSEAPWLRWEDVDFRTARLKVVSGRDGHRTKTGKSRVLPLSTRMLDALRAHFASYRMNGGSPWVFHHVAADRHAKAGDRLNDLRRAFQAAAKQVGLPAGLWPYDLRHTRITRWVSAGHNLALVAEGTRPVDLKRQLRAG